MKCIKDNKLLDLPFTNEQGPHIVFKNDAVLECDGDFKLWGPWNEKLALDYFFGYYKNIVTVKETIIPRKPTKEEYDIIHSLDKVKN